MKVIVELEWSDDERARLVKYLRRVCGIRGLPLLARREDIREFVGLAMDNQWLQVEDTIATLDRLEQAYKEQHADE